MALTPIRTLNQVKAALQRIATAHHQINSFYWGPAYDFATSGTTNYPAMLVDVLPGTINQSTIDVNLIIHICDKERPGVTNEDDIQSDCLQIAKDIMAELKHPDWTWDVAEKGRVNYELFQFTEKDILAGVIFKPTIIINDVDDDCQIPESTITRI
jgi:hypothetical protein